MRAPCLVNQAKEATQAVGSASIVTENIVNMWSRLSPKSMTRAIWLANPDTFPQLSTLTVNVGTGGMPVGLLQYNTSGIAGAPSVSILGRPLFFSPHCQTLGTSGDIILGDFSQYVTISKAGRDIETATSIHVKFIYDETAFRFVKRFDGEPWWASAVTPKHGTNTFSPFVSLATR
jgi:HK97 family phage major capsid protein